MSGIPVSKNLTVTLILSLVGHDPTVCVTKERVLPLLLAPMLPGVCYNVKRLFHCGALPVTSTRLDRIAGPVYQPVVVLSSPCVA